MLNLSKLKRVPRRVRSGAQRGMAMVEALMAIVVFSIGVLGIVGMQARSTQMLTDSVFRAQAAQVASELISEMWTADPSTLAGLYSSAASGNRYMQWRGRFMTGPNMLPGAAANPPTVVVQSAQVPLPTVPGVNFTVSDVTVTVFWQRPGGVVSRYTTTARIMEPQS